MTPCQSSFPESNIILSHLFLCANECFRILHRLSQQFTCFMLGAIPPVSSPRKKVHSQWRIFVLPGLVNIQKTMERSTIVNGKINYFDWAMASIAVLVT